MFFQRVKAVDFIFLIAGAQLGAAAETVHEFTFLIGFTFVPRRSTNLAPVIRRSRRILTMRRLPCGTGAFSPNLYFKSDSSKIAAHRLATAIS
jgi:hypothetical protein